MKIEIWSDIMCPFCYIGKRHFDKALKKFPHKDKVQIQWHSFQLQPDIETKPGKSVKEFLAEVKGISLEKSQQIHENVTKMAFDAGLHYDFDKAIVANTMDAHRLTHLAEKYRLQHQIEERLFSAYFTEGSNRAR
ncbi:DsbA family oxidoreductase [Cytophagaceae bacterium ABcell3]|nr:DsbA family oxidoreductase [Cytophagaceae bacterium ABcell3]